MLHHKKVKDIMIDISDFPHIRHWVTIRQAVQIMKTSLSRAEKSLYPMGILVFDEQYNLLGTLSVKDILKGLEPKFMRPTTKADGYKEEGQELSIIWDALFEKEFGDLGEKSVHELIVPAKFFVEPDDPITKAAYLMIRHDLIFLPVLEGGKKFTGIARMTDVFDELSHAVLNTVVNK
jgi:Mg/Co/Ni transporter MgtE